MNVDYIKDEKTTLSYVDGKGKARKRDLLWGDRCEVISISGDKAAVKARGGKGTISVSALGGIPLLELYFIDVGQGDGVLIVTPDRRHIMIDGGYGREKQPTGKNAADFVDWKFHADYGEKRINLDAMIASHCDADHYGGLWDLISTSQSARAELDTKGTDVDVMYHAGVSWWRDATKKRYLGPIEEIDGVAYLTRLLGDRDSVMQAIDPPAGQPELQGEWGEFFEAVLANGCDIQRISQADGFIPGFEADKEVSIKILAPIEFKDANGNPVLRAYTRNESQNTNGHSLLLRLDYGHSKVLLTGDLNRKSMQAILKDMHSRQDLQCDVAKGCHHGSDDVSFAFLQAMGAACTIISSGDNEGHAHPRPTVVAASAMTGHMHIDNDYLKTPLIYSTEISRSVAIGKLTHITDSKYEMGDDEPIAITLDPSDKAVFHYEVVFSGDLNAQKKQRTFRNGARLVDNITYGLVNVRTDGEKILCATLNEKKSKWEIESFTSRF